MQRAIISLVSALILLNSQTAFALKETEKENVRKQISSVKAWQLTEDLNLSEEQAQALFPAQKAYEDRKEQLRKERQAAEKELDKLLGAKEKDEALIKEKMSRLKSIDEQTRSNEDQFQVKISKILTVEQQAKYELFAKKFDNRLRQMIKDIKREKSQIKTRTEEKSQQAQPKPSEADDQEKQKSEPQKKQTEKREASDEDEAKKKSSSDEKRSPQETQSRQKGSSTQGASRERDSSAEKSSQESGSSKAKSSHARRR